MKWNVFPSYKIPIDYVYYNSIGELCIEHMGWISTPDIEILKQDHKEHAELVSR